MSLQKKHARTAGFIYLFLIITGILHFMVIPGQYLDWENPSNTIAQLKASETLFKLGIFTGILAFFCYLILPLALYRLLKEVNGTHAFLMVVFAIISVPITFVAISHQLDILSLISNAPFTESLSPESLEFEVMHQFNQYNSGIRMSQIFWGLWLIPFGLLVYRSGFIPNFLGTLLCLGGVAILVEFLAPIFISSYSGSTMSTVMGVTSAIAEFGICFYLIAFGVKENQADLVK